MAGDDRQHVILFHDEILVAVEFDLLAGILAEQNLIARLDVERPSVCRPSRLPAAGGEDRASLRLFLGAVGDDDAARTAARLRRDGER